MHCWKRSELKSWKMAEVEISTVNACHSMLKADKKLLKMMYFYPHASCLSVYLIQTPFFYVALGIIIWYLRSLPCYSFLSRPSLFKQDLTLIWVHSHIQCSITHSHRWVALALWKTYSSSPLFNGTTFMACHKPPYKQLRRPTEEAFLPLESLN